MHTPTTGTCDSCGDADDALVTVRRLYVTTPPPVDRDTEAEPVVTPGGQELWCGVCRIHYPHELPAAPG